ncbi:hypothetical protein NIES4102_43770 (plasmid) [Chondrocystis sp. NIES-4102]|nr:hypothetical protein NIES4102_43770 [Chondrocystis sp. NIES-4102]
MNILATSPTSTRHFDMNIAAALGDINAYDKLREWAEAEAQSIEISEMCVSTAQDEGNQILEMKDSKVSLYRDKEYTKKETTKQNSDRLSNEINSIAAASSKQALQKEINSRQNIR